MQRQLAGGVAVAALALSAAACGPNISRDRDASVPMPAAATWSWGTRDTVSRYEMDPAAQNPMLHQWVQGAMEREMEARGFRQVGSPGEAVLVVTYHIGLKRDTELQTTSTGVSMYGGYGGWYGGYGWGMYGAPTYGSSTTREVEYATGGLLVYIRDRATGRVAWRGLFKSDVHDPNQIHMEGVTNAVHALYGDLRAGN